MKAETDPIDENELLYRRVHKDKFRNHKTPYISPKAFEPRAAGRDPDTDGISLYRADCLGSPERLLQSIEDLDKRAANGIVAISVAELQAMNLTVTSTPREDIPGHVSVPEMSAAAFMDERRQEQVRIWMLQLAEIASRPSRIIRDPGIS